MIDDLLKVAESLAKKKGRNEAALRRAASTAYYAAFHALCEVVANSICSKENAALYERVYRMIDHGHINAERNHFQFDADVARIRLALDNLRQTRIEADYIPTTFGRSSRDVLDLITTAAEVICNIRALGDAQREQLAFNLLISPSKPRGDAGKNAAQKGQTV